MVASSKIKLDWFMPGKGAMVARVGAMPAGTGDPSEGVMGESEATGETGKVETGTEPVAELWKVWKAGEAWSW